jgi:hypothetical protein
VRPIKDARDALTDVALGQVAFKGPLIGRTEHGTIHTTLGVDFVDEVVDAICMNLKDTITARIPRMGTEFATVRG